MEPGREREPAGISNSPESPDGGLLNADLARDMLFEKILDQLANSSLFSNSILAPTIFIVYAHDNEEEGAAYDKIVRAMIKWLEHIHARILSDQSALPIFHSRIEGTGAIRNILANQLCLLPPRTDSTGIPTATSVDKVIVCGSEVLERYYNKPSAQSYIGDVVQICRTGADQSITAFECMIRQRVETECIKDDFHHVLTELAFLEVRKSVLYETHGMVPVALNQTNTEEAPMRYLPIFYNTDVKLKLKSPEAVSLHRVFFKLLEQLFPDDRDFIRPFKECYDSVDRTLKLDSKSLLGSREFDGIVHPRITEAYKRYWSKFCVVLRDGRLQAYTGALGDQVSQVLETTDQVAQHKILRWVSPTPAPKLHGKYHDSGTSRMPGTCDWVIKNEKFHQWFSCEGSAILILSGNMGTGKTYATSRAIDWVEQGLSTNDNNEAFAYFYCNKQDPARSEPKEILRNIIRQLATGPWKISSSSKSVHKSVHDLWSKAKGGGINSTFAEWKTCLLALIDTYPRTTIILDALDECVKTQRQDLINLFVTVATRPPDSKPVKIFVSTRSEEDVLQYMDKFPVIRMQKSHTADDIASFVRTKIAEHRRLSSNPDLKNEVIDTLEKKSGDMFLFASLQIEHLLCCSTEPALKARLEKLPDSLEKTYEEVYQRATSDPDERSLLDRAVRWVMCSARPLTTDELLFAICQDSASDKIMPKRRDVDEKLILNLCHNFLCLEATLDDNVDDSLNDRAGKSHPVWRLAHQAVAEFFESHIFCDYDHSHDEIGKVCLMVLIDTFGGESAHSRNNPDHVSGISAGYVCPCREYHHPGTAWYDKDHGTMKDFLLEYAIYAWPTHVRAHEHRGARRDAGLSQALQQFLGELKEGSQIYERWLKHVFGGYRMVPQWSIFWSRPMPRSIKGPPKMGPISLACYLGFYNTLANWWNPSSSDENVKFRDAGSDWRPRNELMYLGVHEPLTWSLAALACVHDEVKIIQRLLDRGAHVDTIEEDEVPPIIVTAANNSVHSLKVLLRCRTEICSPFTKRYGHVMHFAINRNSLKVLELLLNRCIAEPRKVERILTTFSCKRFMSADTVTLLLEKGMDVNSPLRDGSLLAAAALSQCENLVRQLLASDAKVNTQFEGQRFKNALEAAVSQPCPFSIVHLLIEHRARVTTQTVALVQKWQKFGWGETKDEVLQLLLDHDPDLNGTWTNECGDNTSVLIEDVKLGKVDEVQSLLKHGADVNQQVGGRLGDALNTVFRATLYYRPRANGPYPTVPMFEALVEGGVSLHNLEGDRLNAALAAAALAGSEYMVQLLLDHGANPNAFCEHEWSTALGAAAYSEHPRAPYVVRILLDGGAETNTCFPASMDSVYRLALDFPLCHMLDPDSYGLECLDTCLHSASLLLSKGAIWDIDFVQWRERLELRVPEFSRRNAQSLDQFLQKLKRNRIIFFLTHPGAASDQHWRIKDTKDPICRPRMVWREM